MATPITVPSVGESITEGVLARWLKKSGDFVKANEPLFELETEKATSEIPAPVSGIVRFAIPEGQKVAIGATLGVIEQAASTVAETRVSEVRHADGHAVAASPAARQRSADAQIDLNRLSGTGRGGLITKEDVQTYLDKTTQAPLESARGPTQSSDILSSFSGPSEASQALTPIPMSSFPSPIREGLETRHPMSPIRQRIAERLVMAKQTAAILTTFNEADLSAVMELRSRYKEAFSQKYEVGLGFMSFFVKASVEALKAFPSVNCRIEGIDIVEPHAYHIGVAVSTEKGLMVPVIRNADLLTFAQIEKTLAELAAKARAGKIAVSDLQGGTFTITNGGVFGSLLSTPILNPPQSGILGMHTIQKRPVVINDQIVVRPMMYVALSYDHRLIDGREAVGFLLRIKECIENPERLLLEV